MRGHLIPHWAEAVHERHVDGLHAEDDLTAAVAAEKPVFRRVGDWGRRSTETSVLKCLADPRRDLILRLVVSADFAAAVLAAVVVAHCLGTMLCCYRSGYNVMFLQRFTLSSPSPPSSSSPSSVVLDVVY